MSVRDCLQERSFFHYKYESLFSPHEKDEESSKSESKTALKKKLEKKRVTYIALLDPLFPMFFCMPTFSCMIPYLVACFSF